MPSLRACDRKRLSVSCPESYSRPSSDSPDPVLLAPTPLNYHAENNQMSRPRGRLFSCLGVVSKWSATSGDNGESRHPIVPDSAQPCRLLPDLHDLRIIHTREVPGSIPGAPTELRVARTWSRGRPQTRARSARFGAAPGPASNLRAGRVRAAGRCGRGGRGGRRFDDLRSSGGDGVPPGAEGEAALPSCLTRPLLERVGVERVPVVGQHRSGRRGRSRHRRRSVFAKPDSRGYSACHHSNIRYGKARW
jgi:hypothetical protein